MDLSLDAFFRFVRGIAMALQRGWDVQRQRYSVDVMGTEAAMQGA